LVIKRPETFFFILVCFFSLHLKSDSSRIHFLKSVIEKKGVFYQVKVSKRLEGLIQKSVKAISSNPTWLKSYIRENKEKEIIPWHKNLGITKKEYFFMMKKRREQFSLNRLGESRVTVQHIDGDFKVKVEGPSTLGFSFKISEDMKNFTMEGFEGRGAVYEKGRILEPLLLGEGVTWKIYNIYDLDLSQLTGKLGEVSYIELDNHKDCAISIRLKGANRGVVVLNYHFIVKYVCIMKI
jgi:hypothetical protein